LQKFKEAGADVYAIDSAESSGNTLSKRFALMNEASRLKPQIFDLFRSMMKVSICSTVLECYTILHGSKMVSKRRIESSNQMVK
jgi:hypothetical protein